MKNFWLAIFLFLTITACKEEQTSSEELEKIDIRLRLDPQRVHPVFSPTTLGREVFQYIYSPLADFHPETLELYPILIESIPEGREYEDENGEKSLAFDITFKKEARWSDGTDLTSKDYAFTVKAIKHTLSKANAWRSYFNFIKDVVIDPADDNKFSVIMDADYMLSKELCLTTNILPSHIYDKDNILEAVPIPDINNTDVLALDSTTTQLFESFNNSMNDKTDVVQVGPYRLTDFQTDQYIVLEKVEDYWGNQYPDNPFLQGHARQLVFKIVPDELIAVTMAKEGKLDVVGFHQANAFLEFNNDEQYASDWSFHTPQLMMYYYIALNNKNSLLSDINIRKALAHSLDINDFIENLDGGLGIRTIGHFHPTKTYYNHDLSPKEFDLGSAAEYLRQSGWADSDGDDVLDKMIDGQLTALELDLLVTGSALSTTIALLMQEGAAKSGIKINIINKPTPLMRKENFSTYNYDMAALVVGQDAAPDDPYSRWHSDNIRDGGTNFFGYSSPVSDSLISVIRTSRDLAVRDKAYKELQVQMYHDQPVIWLYCPLMKIAINNRLDALTTQKRPGYQANTFKLR